MRSDQSVSLQLDSILRPLAPGWLTNLGSLAKPDDGSRTKRHGDKLQHLPKAETGGEPLARDAKPPFDRCEGEVAPSQPRDESASGVWAKGLYSQLDEEYCQ